MHDFWTLAHVWLPQNEWLSDTEEVREMLKKIEPLIRDRIEKFSDVKTLFENGEFTYFFVAPKVDEKILVAKELRDTADGIEKTKAHLKHIASLLESVPESDWAYENIKSSVWDYADKEGRAVVLWPMRVSLSGKEKSPDPFELASILGKTETLKRLTF
jgi:glutamyl-tRNA synthetase